MKAWILDSIGNINFKETEVPVAGDDEVLVKVRAAGICGSDIPRVYQNGAHNMPLIIGHEFSGEIVEEEKIANGDYTSQLHRRVGIFPLIPCKKCPSCLKKQYEMCSSYNYLGSRCDGGFAEYVAVPKWNIIELPDKVTFEQAAMLEPMAVAVHAIRKSGITTEDTAVVWGAGTIGLLICMFLVGMGIKNVMLVTNHDYQKEYAGRIGVSADNIYCLSGNAGNAIQCLKDKTNGAGPDVFFECVGKTGLMTAAVNTVSAGGTIVTVGNPYSNLEMSRDVYWNILRHQLKIVGTWNSSFYGKDDPEAMKDDWHYVVDRLSTGLIHPELLISHRLKLEELENGLEIMRRKTEPYVKVMCVFD